MLTERSTLPQTEADHSRLAKRIDGTTWGLLLLMTGGLLLEPGMLPEGTWLVAAGAILLGASAVRYAVHLRISAFLVALGLLAVVAGALAIMGFKVPLFAAFLILLGAGVVFRALFGKAEA